MTTTSAKQPRMKPSGGGISINPSESGAAVILLAVALSIVMLALLATAASLTHSVQQPHVNQEQQDYLATVRTRIGAYYYENAWALSQSTTFPLSGNALLTDSDVVPRYNIQICVSGENFLGTYQIPYFNIWLWVPPAGGGSDATCSGGTFTPNNVTNYTEYSGATAQTELLKASEEQVDEVGNDLVAAFAAMQQSGGVHNANIDYFKPGNCDGNNGGGMLSCAENWTNAPAMGLKNMIGAGTIFHRNAWGQELQMVNTNPIANDQTIPFTIYIRSPLPGGQYIENEYAEPLG